MTGTTTPDGIRFPNDPEAPADSINAFAQLAADTQTALTKRMNSLPTSTLVAPSGGWSNATTTGYGQPITHKTGQLVVARGLMVRTSTLTLADNGVYQIGLVGAGFRPTVSVVAAAGWYARNGSSPQKMTAQVIVDADGQVHVVSNVAGSMQVGDWVSLGGIAWFTP